MLKNLIVLPDGTELFSGEKAVNAIQSVKLTQQVNEGTELTLGSTCAGVLEVTLITPHGGLCILPGTELTLYKVDRQGNRIPAGLFVVESAARPSANRYKIKAYDRVSLLSRDLTQWLNSLDEWPYSLYDFAKKVCQACNLTLVNTQLPNGDWQVNKFYASGVTGKKLMQWVGQACGRFCRATVDGSIELAWYVPTDISVTPNGERYYFLDSLQAEDYQVAAIDKVQLQQTDTDVGAVYGTGSNGYVIRGNPLLTTKTLEPLQEVAQTLYNTLHNATYTPCRVSIPASAQVQAGDIIQLTDANGRTFSAYVMTKMQEGQRDTLICVGSPRRDSVTAINSAKYQDLYGKVLEVEMEMEGLRVEAREQNDKISTLEQTAGALSLELRNVVDDGVTKINTVTGYTFDENGMTVEKQGKAIKTQITEDGMTVYKNNNAVLTANSEGVEAVDLHASTYLIIGGRSRFENYGADRTGCFWIGG